MNASSPIRQLRQRSQERRFLELRSGKELQVKLLNGLVVVVWPHVAIFPRKYPGEMK